MKFNPILFLIFLILAGVLAWAGYLMCDTEDQSVAMAAVVGSGLIIAGTCLAIDMGHQSGNVNGKAATISYIALNIVVNTIFSFIDFSISALIITNILMVVLLLLIIYMVHNAGEV